MGARKRTRSRSWAGLIAVAVTVGMGMTAASAAADVTVTGHVTDPDDNPIENAAVVVSSRVGNTTISTGTFTDPQGSYSQSLPAGDVTVRFEGGSNPQYASEYYNNVFDPDDATHFQLADGDTQTVDAQLGLAGTITGIVSDSHGTPVQGLCMTATYLDGDDRENTDTDASGQYSFPSLDPGRWAVEAAPKCSNANLRDGFFEHGHSINTATPVVVTGGQTASGTDFSLEPGASISGTVTEAGPDTPVADVRVEIDTLDGDFVNSFDTGADGTYTLASLAPGTYTVYFEDISGSGLASEYYDGSPDLAGATKITFGSGDERTGVDAALPQEGTIEGTVVDGTLAPLQGICVTAYGSSDTDDGLVNDDETNASGNYSIDGLPPGSYHVRFDNCGRGPNAAPQWWDDKPTFAASTQVAVTTGTATPNINATLADGGSIQGTVTDANGPADDECVLATDSDGSYIAEGFTDTSGSYDVVGLPTGDFTVHFGDCGSDRAPEYYNGALAATSATPVPVAVGMPTNDINAELAIGGEIAGKVTRPDGTPMPDICVNAYDAATGEQVPPPRRDRVTTADNGRYVVSNLAPGSYKIEFQPCESGDADVYSSEFYDDCAIGTATPVNVASGQRTGGINASLALKPAGPACPAPPSTPTGPTGPTGPSGPTGPTGISESPKAPVVTITSGPRGKTTDATPTFSFTADQSATFTCAVDGKSTGACSSPATVKKLDKGSHAFEVTATNAGGLSGSAQQSFKVKPKHQHRHHHHHHNHHHHHHHHPH